MNSKRFHFLMIGLASLLGLAIIGTLYMANTLIKQQSKKLYDTKLKSQVLAQQEIGLAKSKKDISNYAELVREAKLIVPQDKDQAEAVREIVNIAKSSGITISSILFPASTLGNSAPSSSSSTGTSTTTTPTPTTKSPTVTQTQPVVGLKGVYVMPITVQVSNNPVSYSNFTSFLNKLEQNRRTSQVSSVNIQPLDTDPGKVNFILVINAYIKP